MPPVHSVFKKSIWIAVILNICLKWIACAGTESFDVVVYGGTSAGVIAAVKVSRLGKTVVLIEPTEHIGGLTSGGLGATDIGNKNVIGGMSREFYHLIWRHYQKDSSWNYETRNQFAGRGHKDTDTAWTFEPHVAENILHEMLREARVPLVSGERLDLKKGVSKKGNRITEIQMESGKSFFGKMFIDATYEGDLLAKAGVTFTVGREANSKYGETLNGIQTRHAVSHQFNREVDPYRIPGNRESGLLAGIQAHGPGVEYAGDHRVQAYCYRLCATDILKNRVPWPKPDDYDERHFELLFRNFEAGDHRRPWNPVMMPNRKTDSNNNFAISTDNIGMNYDYPEGDYATREWILKEHESYQKGLMWSLANHPRVPEKVRTHFSEWGLAKDEFVDNGNWPHQLYIREARRMVGAYVMTEVNCLRQKVIQDSVGMGAYNMDSHNVQRYVTEEGLVRNEGDVQVKSLPYPISYRSIVPQEKECGNLFAPTCLSASHIAFGSIRMEPVFMVLGHSSAVAAVQAIQEGVNVQQIDTGKLKRQLLADKQVLDLEMPKPAIDVDPTDLQGIVIDDTQAIRSGFWGESRAIHPYVSLGYRHDRNSGKGGQFARFFIPIEKSGDYEIRLAYSANGNRATNVPVTIHHTNGKTTVVVNQRKNPELDKLWTSLGVFPLSTDSNPSVVIENHGTDGYVIVDAIQAVFQ
ncbi:MAG TPA: FAD-dependent oxidoreductase [Verrucomicrobiales bacterium]|nr:FAD-dependent oxidoreductase [Verrucomicrobiales bacterium]